MGEILGVNRHYYPISLPELHVEDRMICHMVVLVEGGVGDYAAYAALTESPEFARDYGDKISFAEACVHFPSGLVKDKYRV